MNKHLLIIANGEIQENSLHTTTLARSERLLEWATNSEWMSEVQVAMAEAEVDAAQAEYPEGCFPHPMDLADRVGVIRDALSNFEVEVYFDDLTAPESVQASTVATLGAVITV